MKTKKIADLVARIDALDREFRALNLILEGMK